MSKKPKNIQSESVNIKKSKSWWLYAILFVLIITNVVSAFYFFNSGSTNQKDEFTLLNPARKLFDQKDLIINVQPLRDYLNNKYETDSNVSVYFEYLPTGANIAISKDAQFYPASLLKIPVAMAAAKKVDKGEWRWDNKLVLMATDKDDKFGTLYQEPTGSVFTIEELVRRSLVDSDNTAHFILLRNLELAEINDVYAHMGLDGFLETDGSISAKRYSVILRSLYNSSYLTEANSQKIISNLSDEAFKDYLKGGIPENVRFAHKIGVDTDKKIYLDSGIVYLESRPYILIVMTKLKTEPQAKEVMKDVSTKVFSYVKNYHE